MIFELSKSESLRLVLELNFLSDDYILGSKAKAPHLKKLEKKLKTVYLKTFGPMELELSRNEISKLAADLAKLIENDVISQKGLEKRFPVLIKIIKSQFKGNITPILLVPAVIAVAALGSEYFKAKSRKYERESIERRNPKPKKLKRKTKKKKARKK